MGESSICIGFLAAGEPAEGGAVGDRLAGRCSDLLAGKYLFLVPRSFRRMGRKRISLLPVPVPVPR
jgi:hypothetical protein